MPGKDEIVQLEASLVGFGISVINDTPQELLYATITGPRVSMETSKYHQKVECTIDTVQVDNQLPFSHFPVFLNPIQDSATSSQRNRSEQFLRFSLLKQLYPDEDNTSTTTSTTPSLTQTNFGLNNTNKKKEPSNDTNHFKRLEVQPKQFAVNAEGEIIVELIKFKNAIDKSLELEKINGATQRKTAPSSSPSPSHSGDASSPLSSAWGSDREASISDVSISVDRVLHHGQDDSNNNSTKKDRPALFEPPPSTLQSTMICFDKFSIHPIQAKVNFGYVPGVDYSVLSSIVNYTGRKSPSPRQSVDRF
mgnify:CR=1 FL=1